MDTALLHDAVIAPEQALAVEMTTSRVLPTMVAVPTKPASVKLTTSDPDTPEPVLTMVNTSPLVRPLPLMVIAALVMVAAPVTDICP